MSNGDDEPPADDASEAEAEADGNADADGEESAGAEETESEVEETEAEETEAESEAEVEETETETEETEAEETETEETVPVTQESLDERLDAVEADLEAAETEVDLDDIEAEIDAIEADLEEADLSEPDEDEDDEDAADPRAELEERIEDVRSELESQRGPYAEDATDAIDEAIGTIEDTRWTDRGEGEIADAVGAFAESINKILDTDLTVADPLSETLEAASAAIEDEGLDADDDADTIAELIEATDALSAGLEDAEEWDDLTTSEQLEAQGFYEVLDHRKDYPPEWHALKVWEKRGNAEMVLLALENLGSEFMEEHCLDALRRMAPQEAIDPMLQRAGRRDQDAIEILGKIGADEALETITEYLETDSDPQLQKVTLRAVAEIGSTESTQAVANVLDSDNDIVRSQAARALGMLGDPRAIEPLTDVLDDDENDTVRASAAWALYQIGTEAALETASEHVDDSSYLVQAEAEKAADAIETTATA